MYGYYRVALCTPEVKVADVSINIAEIQRLSVEACGQGAAVIVFPELAVTGYSCGDLFQNASLIKAVIDGILTLAKETAALDAVIVFGAPLVFRDRLYNCALVLRRGKILGVVPKSYIPNYKEFYEKRWFSSGKKIVKNEVYIGSVVVPFGTDLIFEAADQCTLGIEICEDLWSTVPPSTHLAEAGCELLLNLSASNEVVGKSDYRRTLVQSQSARLLACYAYVSSGPSESSSDLVFSGHRIVSENGILLADKKSMSLASETTYADFDAFRLRQIRRTESGFGDADVHNFRSIPIGLLQSPKVINRVIDRLPFVPFSENQRSARCADVLTLQTLALTKRIEHTKTKTLVLGVSGGLDSTLALLVCSQATKAARIPVKLLAVSLPGFGTSKQTRLNAAALSQHFTKHFLEIDIKEACRKHFKDIGHDGETQDVTFENVQARERTQILMDLANKESGMVVGTGDLSEIALGWSTYNGDHMSMYNVNCGVPKTLIRHLIRWCADSLTNALKQVLKEVLDTPVSPELIKTDGEAITQKTEDLIGPYEVHDFFLYHLLRYGAGPDRVLGLAQIAFGDDYTTLQLKEWLTLFIKRFFANQFKRNTMPDGPKVGTIALSPRGDWRMPSDAVAEVWLREIK